MTKYIFLLITAACPFYSLAFEHSFSYLLNTRKKSKNWHAQTNHLPTSKLQEQFLSLLRKCSVAWQKPITDQEEIAQMLQCLTLLKHFLPHEKFSEYQLQDVLDATIDSAQILSIPEECHPFAVQPFLDTDYFLKILTKNSRTVTPENLLKKHLKTQTILAINDPFKALIYWLYLTITATTHPKPLRQKDRLLNHLISVIKKDQNSHGYLCAYQVFYATHYGQSSLSKNSRIKEELMHYLKDVKQTPLSLTAHLFLALKLIGQETTPQGQILAARLYNAEPKNPFELYLLTAACT